LTNSSVLELLPVDFENYDFYAANLLATHDITVLQELKCLIRATLHPTTEAKKKWSAYYHRSIAGLTVRTHMRGPKLYKLLSIKVKDTSAERWMLWGSGGGPAYRKKLEKHKEDWLAVACVPGKWEQNEINELTIEFRKVKVVGSRRAFTL
jgi:hypothetical protein